MLRKHAALLFNKYAQKAVKPLRFGCFLPFQQLFSVYKPLWVAFSEFTIFLISMLWNKECIAHRTNPKLQFIIIHQIGQLVKCYIKKGNPQQHQYEAFSKMKFCF